MRDIGHGRRSLLGAGLLVVLRRPGALLWTYALNLLLAFLFSLRFGAQTDDVLSHSLNAQRLSSGFDLSKVLDTLFRISSDAPSTGSSGYLGTWLYLLLYFLLVPGALYCYQTDSAAKLSTLLSAGLLHFWRFVRIAVFAGIVFGLLLGPMFAGYNAWVSHVDKTVTGYPALAHELPVLVLIGLLAALVRLYFDLVEVYTVQLGMRMRPNGRPDRRVRKALLPAWRALRRNFWRSYGVFVLLTVLGIGALGLLWYLAIETLAQPRVFPLFLLAQLGLFLLMLSRFWQRGAETVLAQDYPIPAELQPVSPFVPVTPYATPSAPAAPDLHSPSSELDPLPPPEPVSPSLGEPDPAVYRPSGIHRTVTIEEKELT